MSTASTAAHPVALYGTADARARRPPRPARFALAVWRDEPGRVQAALLAILVLSLPLLVWNLGRAGDFEYYGAAVRSMTVSWRAFVFGAFDPAATVTLDKLSGFLVPQAVSARLFGFSWSAIALPQVVEGLITTWCCATIALRLAGARAGLIAAAAAASTPIFVSMFGRPMEDGLLTMALAAALLWWQRGAATGRLAPFVVAGALVGLGFQAKMLQAWLILPALVVALLVGSRLRVALRRAGALVGSAVVVSLAWMTFLQLLPAGVRPRFDGSVGDSVFSTVFLYNGIDRLLPIAPSDASTAVRIDADRLLRGLHLTGAAPAQTAAAKLLMPYYTSQVGWLYPLAIAGLVLAVRRALRSDAAPGRRRALVALLVWTATAAAVLSRAALPHTAYVAAIGVQVVLLAALAVDRGIAALTEHGPRRLLLPALLIAEGAWSVHLALIGALPALLLVLLGLALGAGVLVLALAFRRGRATPSVPAAPLAATVVVALLAGAITWSAQSIDPQRAGEGSDAYVGSRAAFAGTTVAAWAPQLPHPRHGEPVLGDPLADAVARVRGTGAPPILFATDSERISSFVIEATGAEVLTDGGYTSGVPVLTDAQLTSAVASGDLRWLLTFEHPPVVNAVDRLAATPACRLVHVWPPQPGTRLLGHGLALYRCAPSTSGVAGA